MINHYKKISFTELENMRNKLFHKIYMDIYEKMLSDEGQKQLEAEAMGGTASLLAAMGGFNSGNNGGGGKKPSANSKYAKSKKRR